MSCCIRSLAVILSLLTIASSVFSAIIWYSITDYWHFFVWWGIPVATGSLLILGAITSVTVILTIYLFADGIRCGLNVAFFIASLIVVIWRKESHVETLLNMEGLHRFLRNHEKDMHGVKVFDYMHYCLIFVCVIAFLEILNTVCMLALGRSIQRSSQRKEIASMFQFANPDTVLDGVDRLIISSRIADSILYKSILSFKLSMNIVGLALLLYEYVKRSKMQSVTHPNINVILNCIRAFSVLFLMGYTVTNSYDLYRFSKPVNYEAERMNKACVFIALRMVTTVATVGTLIALVMLALERIISTVEVIEYEDAKKPGLCLAVLVFLTASASIMSFCLLYTDIDFDAYQVLSSAANSRNRQGYTLFLIVLLIFEFIVLCLCVVIKVWNAHLFRSVRRTILSSAQQRRQLSMKYQINENIKVARLFIPVSCFIFLFYSITVFGTWAAQLLIKDTVLRLCVNEAIFLQSWAAHAFAICSLYRMGEIPCTRLYALRNSSKVVATESQNQFLDRQRAMFDGPMATASTRIQFAPKLTKKRLPQFCGFSQPSKGCMVAPS